MGLGIADLRFGVGESESGNRIIEKIVFIPSEIPRRSVG